MFVFKYNFNLNYFIFYINLVFSLIIFFIFKYSNKNGEFNVINKNEKDV